MLGGINFADLVKHTASDMEAGLAAGYAKQGIPKAQATLIAKEAVEDFREFAQFLETATSEVPVVRPEDALIAHMAWGRITDVCKRAWLEQRFASQVRRHAP